MDNRTAKYVQHYQNKTDKQLRTIRGSLWGNRTQPTHRQRIEAIDFILGGGSLDDLTEDVADTEDGDVAGEFQRHDDVLTAMHYIRKYHNARKRGVDFLLSMSDYRRMEKRRLCYYTGVEMNNVDGHPNQRTIERLDNSKPYTKENCVACSLMANQLKANCLENPASPQYMTARQFKRMAKRLQ